jgi:hypothetical protein
MLEGSQLSRLRKSWLDRLRRSWLRRLDSPQLRRLGMGGSWRRRVGIGCPIRSRVELRIRLWISWCVFVALYDEGREQ